MSNKICKNLIFKTICNKANIPRKIILIILLYTILFSNSSIFFIFANDMPNEETTQILKESKDVQIKESKDTNDPLNLVAKNAVLIDAKSGIVLYDKNKDTKAYPASITKILTALLTLQNTKLTDIVTHSHNAVFGIGPGSSHIGMREGEQITVEQALYGVLLASANEVCVALAEHVSGSQEKFVELMNKTAKKLGAKNTNFANPHGFHDPNHYTTSYDIALIMKEAIKNDEFKKIIGTYTYTIPKTNIVDVERILHNTDRLIKPNSQFEYEYAVGGKTGFTDEAGNTLVSYAKKGDIGLIAVVMKDDGTEVYEDSVKLFEYGFSNYKKETIFKKDTYESKANVSEKYKDKNIPLGEIYLSAKDDVILNMPKSVDTTKIVKKINIKNPVIAPVKIGDKAGEITFTYKGNLLAKVDIISNTEIETTSIKVLERKENTDKLIKKVIKISKKVLTVLSIVFVAFIIFAFIARILTSRRRQKRRSFIRSGQKNIKSMKKRKKRR